jgi:hypothetical protein
MPPGRGIRAALRPWTFLGRGLSSFGYRGNSPKVRQPRSSCGSAPAAPARSLDLCDEDIAHHDFWHPAGEFHNALFRNQPTTSMPAVALVSAYCD